VAVLSVLSRLTYEQEMCRTRVRSTYLRGPVLAAGTPGYPTELHHTSSRYLSLQRTTRSIPARGRLPHSPSHGSRPTPGGPSTGAPGPADEGPAVRRAQLAVCGGSGPAGSAGRTLGADHIEAQDMSEDGGAAEGGRVSVRDRRVSPGPSPERSHRMCGQLARED
jgi:hypothetical protein